MDVFWQSERKRPGILARGTGRGELLLVLLTLRTIVGGFGFRRKEQNLFMVRLGFRCLLNIQVKLWTKQLEIQI